MRYSFVAALSLLCSFPAPCQDTAAVGGIEGHVSDPAGAPIVGARVCLVGLERCVETDGDGAFALENLRTGEYQLQVAVASRPAFVTEQIAVRAGLDDQVEIVLPAIDAIEQAITVSESVYVAPQEVKTSGVLIQGSEIFRAAGALQDVSRYVRSLPGVAIGSEDFRNDIIVRGGSPLENLFIVDNVEIPNINTFANFASAGGITSILDANLIQDVTFLTGGYPAPFVNRLSSVLQIAQKEGSREEFGGRATVGFAGAGVVLDGPIKRQRGSWIVSARRSFLDLFTNDVGFGGVPKVYTFSGKALYDLSPKDRIWGVNISGVDSIRLGLTEDSDLTEELSALDIRYQGWRSASGFNWQHLFGSQGVGLLGITHSEARVESTVKDLLKNGIPDPSLPVDDVIANGAVTFQDNSREGETTLKYDLTWFGDALGKLQAGGNFKIFNINYDTRSPLGYDGPFTVQPDVNPIFLQKDFTAYQTGAYLQTSRNLTNRLNLTWGGRLDHYQFLEQARFSPRAGLSYRLTDKLSWRASYGQYFQQPFFLFLAAYPQNRNLVPIRSEHFVTGFSYVASPSLRVTLEGYRKTYKDYPVSTDFPTLSLANVGDTFDVRDVLFPMTSAGRGQVRGVELFIEKKFTTKWFGQANVSWSRTRHADSTKCAGPALTTIPSSPISWAGGDSAARELARVLFTCAVGPTLPSMRCARENSGVASSIWHASIASAPRTISAWTCASTAPFTSTTSR
ncbi:MAG: TonB-dependent receptor [Bryobacterales bacterium]